MVEMIPLSQIEPKAVEALLDAAFGIDRQTRTAYRMRAGVSFLPALSFAAVEGARLLGSVQCWPIALAHEGALTALTLVGPVAVAPTAQGEGLGKALMEAMLAAADAEGADALLLIGDADYYGRFFGFTAEATGAWVVPGPVDRARLLARIRRPAGVPAHGHIIADPAFATEPTNA
jgi:predicted N-acetyltransferase YhbS